MKSSTLTISSNLRSAYDRIAEALIAADSIACPECGVSFGGEWDECPECAATAVNSISVKCESCGAEFEIED